MSQKKGGGTEVKNNKTGSLDTEGLNQSNKYSRLLEDHKLASRGSLVRAASVSGLGSTLVSIPGYNQQKSPLDHLGRQGGCHGALKHQGFAARVSTETHTAITL